eukprot:CAMPEP_0170061478 /NCGR_PEP_ID=MMETSP0019_2-20121128/3028_1 /TAXON_ID=98059 /ORGANISM="Dinobryon sp., Strain UTEXLB2267" /LENGTH=427 /DNA_ID=CAMNT_0010267313 /DNA_START=206 /DNA_END=1490 /DNA_ORIENTATION=-
MPSTNASTNAAMPSSNASVARSEVDEFEDRELGDTLFEDKNSDGEMYLKESTPSQEESPRLLETMSVMLESVIGKVECNPRSVKRSVNLLQIISEIAKNKPVTGTLIVNISIPDAKIAGSEDDDSADGMKAINVKEEGLGDLLFEGENSDGEKLVKISMAFNEEFQRLPETMSAMLESVIGKVECNPRSVKRSVNLLQIISEIAKNKPVTDLSPPVKIAKWEGGKKWKIFSEKTVLWIFMAQNFTFRLSALVQVLLDFEQKKDFNNEISHSYKYKPFTLQNRNKEGDKSAATDHLDKFDEMSIFDFYQNYVEKFIHVFRLADRLSRVDKDPEEFAYLLGKCHDIGVKCEDILGPQIQNSTAEGDSKEVQRRRKDFSLLSYSFNLDPAMRLEIGGDMTGLVSEHEMSHSSGFILQEGSVMRKKNFLLG